jgi:hypothetical protein
MIKMHRKPVAHAHTRRTVQLFPFSPNGRPLISYRAMNYPAMFSARALCTPTSAKSCLFASAVQRCSEAIDIKFRIKILASSGGKITAYFFEL